MPDYNRLFYCQRLMLALVAFAGCGGRERPLTLVTITGGTAEQRDVVAQEVERFDQATGGVPLELHAIEIRGLEDRKDAFVDGYYNRLTDVIAIDVALTPEALPGPLWHELCHAYERTLDIGQARDTVWDEVAESDLGDQSVYSGVSDRVRRNEAFAIHCSLGPDYAWALTQGCPRDRSDGVEIGEALVDTVYAPATSPLDPRPDHEIIWQRPTVADLVSLGATSAPGVVLVTEYVKGQGSESFANLYTGAATVETGDFVNTPIDPPAFPSVWGLWRFAYRSCPRGWPDGPGAAIAAFSAYEGPELGPRLAAYSDGTWAIRDCARVDEQPFAADGAIWSAWRATDSEVRWARLSGE